MQDQTKAKLDTLNQIIGMADDAMLGEARKRKTPAVQPPMAVPATEPAEIQPPMAAPKDDLDSESAKQLMDLYDKDDDLAVEAPVSMS